MPLPFSFILDLGPAKFACHGTHDSCQPVKIPRLLSECSMWLKTTERGGRKLLSEVNLQGDESKAGARLGNDASWGLLALGTCGRSADCCHLKQLDTNEIG